MGSIVGVVIVLGLYVFVLLVCMLVLLNCIGYCVDELLSVECSDVVEWGIEGVGVDCLVGVLV